MVLFAIFCASILAAGCEDTQIQHIVPDKSIAASVAFAAYRMEIEGTYDGVALDDFQSGMSYLSIKKESETTVQMYCHATWSGTMFDITVPGLPLSGTWGNASFDFTTSKAKITRNEAASETGTASAAGQIKREETADGILSGFDFQIDIACSFDGKPLTLKITAQKP